MTLFIWFSHVHRCIVAEGLLKGEEVRQKRKEKVQTGFQKSR